MKRITVAVLSLLSPALVHAGQYDCDKYWDYYKEAGKRFNLDPYLIKAVCIKESNQTNGAINSKNRNQSVDFGACQINSFWSDLFENEFGVSMHEVRYDMKTVISASAYVLAYNFDLRGYSLNSLGAYNVGWLKKHQATRDNYAQSIMKIRSDLKNQCQGGQHS